MLLFRSHYSQEEPSGLRTDDFDGNHLPVINEAGRRVAQINYGTNFHKYVSLLGGEASTRLEIPDLFGINFSTGDWAAFTWFYSDVPFTDNFLMAKRSNDDICWAIRIAYDQLRFETSGNDFLIDVSYLPKPTYQTKHMVGVSYSHSYRRKRVFFDGILQEDTAFHSNTLFDNHIPFALGGMSYGGKEHEGWMDQTGLMPTEPTLDDWLFIWNNGNGRPYTDYLKTKGRLHNKVQLVSVGYAYPSDYIGIIPGSAERLNVPGTAKEEPFNPPVSVPLPTGYSWIKPDEYTGVQPEENQ